MLDQSNAILFYQNVYCGRYAESLTTLGQSAAFERAAVLLDVLTFGRASRVTVPALERMVHFAQCAIVDELIADAEVPARVASETTAHVTVTYTDNSSDNVSMQRYRTTAMQYLGHTGLMYRGGGV